jgi:putative ABC transport system permease protein
LRLLRQHLSFATRQLRRSPGFTLTVVATLALSIGANTAIFSLVNALILKDLPYPHPEQMGTIYARVTGSAFSESRTGIDGEKWELLRDHVPALLSAVASGVSGVNLQAESRAQYVHEARISAHYLDVLAVQPVLGRNFLEDEDRPHGPKAAIVGYPMWRNMFACDPGVVGKTILLRGEPYTVVGVLAENAVTPLNADLYTTLQPSREGEGGGTNFTAITRLRSGASWQQADTQLNLAWAQRASRFRKSNPGAQISYYSVPFQKGQTDSLRPQVLGLMFAAGFILLIACCNLAGLTLVRMLRRDCEIATRLALGASRWQIQKQFWLENLLVALIGGASGVGVGFLALRGLLLLLPERFLPVAGVSLDLRVLAFAAMTSLLTSVLFGMLPALPARNTDLRSAIAGRGIARAGSLRLRQSLIAGEVALTLVLLAASGLLIRSLIHLETLPPGFNPHGVVTAKASLDEVRFHDPAVFRRLLDQSIAAMREVPGVEHAAVGLTLPYERAINDGVVISDGREAGQQDGTDVVYVTPEYFATLQMPLLAGRLFTPADGPDAQPVAVVNQAFSRHFFGGTSPLGRHLNKDTVIIGEVADVSVSSGLYPGAPLMSEQAMYIPAAQVPPEFLRIVHVWVQPNWVVRARAPVTGLAAQMQSALASVDPNLPFSGFYSMDDLQARTLATQQVEVALLGAMAALALALSAVGIFALVANLVAQRTREIGIRMALGSTIIQAMTHVGRTGAFASFLGLVLGLLLCAGLLRVMRSILFGVNVYDPLSLLAVALILAAVTLLAIIVPTLKISTIDPATTLREE